MGPVIWEVRLNPRTGRSPRLQPVGVQEMDRRVVIDTLAAVSMPDPAIAPVAAGDGRSAPTLTWRKQADFSLYEGSEPKPGHGFATNGTESQMLIWASEFSSDNCPGSTATNGIRSAVPLKSEFAKELGTLASTMLKGSWSRL
jgi:hypothetical protein